MSWLWLKIQLNYHSTWVSALLFLPIDAVSLQKQMVPCIQLQQRRCIVKLTWTDSLSSCVSLQSKAQRNKNESNRTSAQSVCMNANVWRNILQVLLLQLHHFSLHYFLALLFYKVQLLCRLLFRVSQNSFKQLCSISVAFGCRLTERFLIPSFFILSTQLLPDRWVV